MSLEAPTPRWDMTETWPPVRGDYRCGQPRVKGGSGHPGEPSSRRGCSPIGPCKTENLGVEKIVANTISNSNIRFLLLCGMESKGHLPGNTLLALHKNGIDETGKNPGIERGHSLHPEPAS